MYSFGILLCIVATGVHHLTEATPPATLSYDCDTDGKIRIHSMDPLYKSVYAWGTLTLSSNAGYCTVRKGTGVDFEITDCKPDMPITVYIMKIPGQNQVEGNTSDITTKIPAAFVIGGEGITAYNLECYKESQMVDAVKNLPPFYEVTKAAPIFISPVTPKTLANGSYAITELLIRKSNGAVVTENDNILIGDTLHVVLIGPVGPMYFVKSCQAYAPGLKDTTAIQLIGNGKELHSELMTQFSNSTAKDKANMTDICSSAKSCQLSSLYTFHFQGSTKVTLECAIVICNKASAQCQATVRRKRSEPYTTGSDGMKTLSRTITVYDHLQIEFSSAISGSTTNFMVFAIMIVCSGFIWLSE